MPTAFASPCPSSASPKASSSAIPSLREPLRIERDKSTAELRIALADGEGKTSPTAEPWGVLPPLYPEWLGDRGFLESHGVRFPYVTGSMANGIATPRMVVSVARAGMLGFFGAAGMSLEKVDAGLEAIVRDLQSENSAWGANLIHSPQEPELEARVASLYADRDVPCIEVSAFMDLRPSVVRLASRGLRVDGSGRVVRRHRIMAKVSRTEVARRFMMPAPEPMLRALVERGELSADEARLAARIPVAEDITVEADSGGHTDNRPLGALFPTMLTLRDEVEALLDMRGAIRVGAAGGLGTPSAVAAAFALGAAYVLTGSVNQATIESGLSEEARTMLAQADVADVTMAAAADMFELGVKLQVLKRGTLFAARANKLYEIYRAHEGLESLSPGTRCEVEKILGASIESVMRETARFWTERDPSQLARAEADPKHRMALVFRWYLGCSSRWAIRAEAGRRADYQIWCGPAMGAFNAWVKGSFLENPARRSVVQVARNLLEGAAHVTRAHQLRSYGIAIPSLAIHFRPRPLE